MLALSKDTVPTSLIWKSLCYQFYWSLLGTVITNHLMARLTNQYYREPYNKLCLLKIISDKAT